MDGEGYGPETDGLLLSFDRTAQLVTGLVAERYGQEEANALYRDARQEYEEIIPRVPRMPGARARMLNSFLRISAQEVAVYKAMKAHGKSAAEAWEICHAALRLRMAEFPRWKGRLLKLLMFSAPVRWIMRRRAARRRQLRVGDFIVSYVMPEGDEFDFGVDYVRCGILEMVRELDAEEFAPYVCMSDIALSEAIGWGLTRTQTLADGCDHCDFRFKEGGPTRITSKTRAVQEVIDAIGRKENEAGAQSC
jgi:hypothetical protein